jgi:hypothetical protein
MERDGRQLPPLERALSRLARAEQQWSGVCAAPASALRPSLPWASLGSAWTQAVLAAPSTPSTTSLSSTTRSSSSSLLPPVGLPATSTPLSTTTTTTTTTTATSSSSSASSLSSASTMSLLPPRRARPPTHILRLSHDELALVLRHLGRRERLVASRVCRRFAAAARDPLAWRPRPSLAVARGTRLDRFAAAGLAHLPLAALVVAAPAAALSPLTLAAAFRPQASLSASLRSLVLRECAGVDDEALSAAAPGLVRLDELALVSATAASDVGLKALAAVRSRALRRLTVTHNARITDDGVRALVAADTTVALDLFACRRIDGSAVRQLVAASRRRTAVLEELNLGCCPRVLSESDPLGAWRPVWAACPALRVLSIKGVAGVRPSVLAALASSAAGRSLVELDVSMCPHVDAAAVLAAAVSMQQLAVLRVIGCLLVGAEGVCAAQEARPGLQVVHRGGSG